MPQQESTFLYNTTWPSDKVYNAHLIEVDGGWQVEFEYGRRGAYSLNRYRKPERPTGYAEAKLVYDEQIRKKKAKGYYE